MGNYNSCTIARVEKIPFYTVQRQSEVSFRVTEMEQFFKGSYELVSNKSLKTERLGSI